MEKMEVRSLASLNASAEGELRVEGLVNKTGSWSEVLGGRRKFRERVLPGVFKKAIERAKNIDFLAEHNKGLLLSSTQNGSLELWEDSEGLQMRAMIAPTSYGKDIYELIKSGLKTKMSFGMQVLKESWEAGVDGIPLRTIEDIEITEVSTVRNPCYSQSSIEARGIELVEEVEVPEEITEGRSMENNNFDVEALKKLIKEEILEEIRALEQEKLVEEEIKEEIKDEVEDKEDEKGDIEDEKDDIKDESKDDLEDEIEDKVEDEIEKKVEEKSSDSSASTPGDDVVAEASHEESQIQEEEAAEKEEPKVEGNLITDEERQATMKKLLEAKEANRAKRL